MTSLWLLGGLFVLVAVLFLLINGASAWRDRRRDDGDM
jgi:hypothetical protein